MPTGISRAGLAKAEDVLIKLGCLLQIVNLDRDVNDARHVFFLLQNSTNVLMWVTETGHGIPCPFIFSISSSARQSSVCLRRPLLTGGLRRRLPRDEFPALRRFCPGIEEHEPQAARLAVDLRLDRCATGDECGVAHETHLAIAAGRALVLRLSRAQGRKPRRLGVGEARGVGIEKLVVKHRLERSEIAAAHRRITLVLEGEDFLVAAHWQTSLAVSPRPSSLRQAAWCLHSITSSARASSVEGTSRPLALWPFRCARVAEVAHQDFDDGVDERARLVLADVG